MMLALLSCPGCLTSRVTGAWKDSGRATRLDLRTIASAGSAIRLGWRAESGRGVANAGEMALDTQLKGCERIKVLATDGGRLYDISSGQERSFSAFSDIPAGTLTNMWTNLEDGHCSVMLIVAIDPDSPEIAIIRASTMERQLGAKKIPSSPNHAWLALMPLSLIADVTVVAAIAVVLVLPWLLIEYLDQKY